MYTNVDNNKVQNESGQSFYWLMVFFLLTSFDNTCDFIVEAQVQINKIAQNCIQTLDQKNMHKR